MLNSTSQADNNSTTELQQLSDIPSAPITPNPMLAVGFLNEMGIKYSKEQFEGYTHRFLFRVLKKGDWSEVTTLNIYSNDGNKEKLLQFLEKNKKVKETKFILEHTSTKEQDEISSKFLDDFLNGDCF